MNIRRWVYLGQIVLTVHHILSSLHLLKQRAEKRISEDFNMQYRKNLNFLLVVLQQCCDGIDMNLITYQHLTHI
jgi:hypothetical protein